MMSPIAAEHGIVPAIQAELRQAAETQLTGVLVEHAQ
jgi:hypothetical protein